MRFFKNPGVIRAVSFDLDDTLYDNQPVIQRAEEEFAQLLQHRYQLPESASDHVFWRGVRIAVLSLQPVLLNDVNEWRIRSLEAAFKLLRRPLAGGRVEAEGLLADFVRLRSRVQVPPYSAALLKRIRARYPLAALSNGNVDLRQLGLEDSFDYNLRPSLKGPSSKPAASMFQKFAELAGVRIQEILHVGDEPFTDIHGAVWAGCQCAWLYRGLAWRSPDETALRVLPCVQLDSLGELEVLLKL